MGGTNCHVVLAEHISPVEAIVDVAGVVPWVVSGRGVAGLRAVAGGLADWADACGDVGVGVVGRSLVGRSGLDWRAVLVGDDWNGLVAGLRDVARGEAGVGVVEGVVVGGAGRPVLVFAGQGSQWLGMGVELLESSPVFAARLGECGEALSRFVEWSLLDVLRGVEGAPDVSRVDVVQPVLWAVMVGLAELWRSFGVVPSAVVGHSQGEIAAAVVVGVLSLGDAARVVAVRSRLLGSGLAGRGGMVSVELPVGVVEGLVGGWGVSVAVVNGPGSTVVSGPVVGVESVVAWCEREGVRCGRVDVDYASHSAAVEVVREELLAGLAGSRPGVWGCRSIRR